MKQDESDLLKPEANIFKINETSMFKTVEEASIIKPADVSVTKPTFNS